MIGIKSFGCYIPWYRLDRGTIRSQMGWFNTAGYSKGEKAVANHDEDSVTMAYAAARNCIGDMAPEELDTLHLASMSLPYANRQNAVIVAKALGMRADINTADLSGSTKCGIDAALDILDGKTALNALVCASEVSAPKPGSPQEYSYGDGAAALLLGSGEVVAEYLGSYRTAYDFIDARRLTAEEFEHYWEERWIRDEGYGKMIPEAIWKALESVGFTMDDISKFIIACPNAAAMKGITTKLGIPPEKLQDTLSLTVGDTRSALPIMMLCAALDSAAPGDRVLVAGYGYGCSAAIFQTTEKITERACKGGFSRQLEKKTQMKDFLKYLAFRRLLPMELGIRGETVPPTAMTALWQQGAAVASLEGERCKVCGLPQFPKHKICVNPDCLTQGQMEDYDFSRKTAKVVSYTADHLVFSWDAPLLNGVVDFPEGGRIYMEFTDCLYEDLTVGTPVEMTFRRKYDDNATGYIGYFWKAVPSVQKGQEV